MQLHELKASKGARKDRKRVGRGNSSGHGTFSGKGSKGQNARTGGGVRAGFEGGQTPLYRRLPKLKGFTNIFKVEYQVVNVADLAKFTGVVEATTLKEAGLIRSALKPVKLLGNGEISTAVTVKVQKVSKIAEDKISKAGGSVELIK